MTAFIFCRFRAIQSSWPRRAETKQQQIGFFLFQRREKRRFIGNIPIFRSGDTKAGISAFQLFPRSLRDAGARAVKEHAAGALREPGKEPRHKVCARNALGKGRSQNARGTEIAHAVREHERRGR